MFQVASWVMGKCCRHPFPSLQSLERWQIRSGLDARIEDFDRQIKRVVWAVQRLRWANANDEYIPL